MTAPNNTAVQRCINEAVTNAGVETTSIDAINGHLTATSKDTVEIENWSKALNREGADFPYVNSFKSHFGHCLAAAGSIECVATVLQLDKQLIFRNLNCEEVHPDILKLVSNDKIPQETLNFPVKIIAKASFGFGDVNACIIFSKYTG